MTTAPSVLVFDVNETLIDIESMAPFFERVFGDPRAMREWFNQLVIYSMTATLSGHYVDYFSLGQGLLPMLANIHGVEITDDDVQSLKHGMLTMPAHPDVEGWADSVARQRLSPGYADKLATQPGWAEPAGTRRARSLFRANVQRRHVPRVQTRADGIPLRLRGTRGDTRQTA